MLLFMSSITFTATTEITLFNILEITDSIPVDLKVTRSATE